MPLARQLWQRIETLHAVTYFAPESIDAAKRAGLQGFWMGYFGFRAAPLGRVEPAVVEAAFANFAAGMVRRSLPDAWRFADPGDLVRVRAGAAAGALRRVVPGIDRMADDVADTLTSVVAAGDPLGRPMFAANRALEAPDDPVERLWQCCTTLREHRGDGHVLSLASRGVDGCEAHLLLIAEQGLPVETFQGNRGWSDGAWEASSMRLRARGLIADGRLTDEGRRVRSEVERATDQLALEPFHRALPEPSIDALLAALTPAAISVARSGLIPFPNPMGLPPIDA